MDMKFKATESRKRQPQNSRRPLMFAHAVDESAVGNSHFWFKGLEPRPRKIPLVCHTCRKLFIDWSTRPQALSGCNVCSCREPLAAMWLVGVGLVLAGLVLGTCGMQLIRTSELKNQSGQVAEGKLAMARIRAAGTRCEGRGSHSVHVECVFTVW